MNKELVKKRFAKSLSSYDENARIQKKMAERLAGFTNSNSYDSILEIGCGTGFLTELLNNKLDFNKYSAIDIVEDCKSYIKNINPKINFINEDIETFLNQNKDKFDLIISNAALQWVENFEEAVKKIKNHLTDNGEIIFSTFGKENFREIEFITGVSLNYYSIKELELLFPESKIYLEIHVMAFNSPKDVLKHLQLTGVNAIESKIWTKTDLLKFENAYRNLCSIRPTLTYNPIYIKYTNNSK